MDWNEFTRVSAREFMCQTIRKGDYYNQHMISQCENHGNIKGNYYYVAGIVGVCETNVEMDGCINYGEVSSTYEYVAGIVGYTSYPAKITNCANHGNVRSYDYYVAGIVGYVGDAIIIDNCLNTGDIVSYNGVNYYDDYVGGIAGYINGYQSEVKNCKNTGAISGEDEVGGIIGATSNSGTAFEDYPGIYVFVSNCQNEGDILAGGGNEAAGIVGEANSNSAWVDKCSNSGKITGDYYVGGITGYKASVTNSYNTSDIEGYEYVGGIVGYAYGASDAYELVGNCYNRGNVTAEYYAGGIVGYISEYVEANNCYTTGEISASSDLGAVIGYIGDENDTKLSALFYPEELDNASGYGTSMSDSNMKTNILLDALNASVNLWNVSNTYNVPFEAWEFRNGLNDGYPVLGFSNVSVSEVAETGSFSVYPNPAKDYVMIVNGKGINAEIRMFDMFGKLVKSFGTTNDSLIRVDVSDLTNGVYVIRMGNETAKIVKH